MTDLNGPSKGDRLDAMFHALSDARRREMLVRLSLNAQSVKELAEPLEMRLPAAIKHLAVLEAGGLVASNKQGRVRTYHIERGAFDRINGWIERREMALTAAFDRLDAAIAAMPGETDE